MLRLWHPLRDPYHCTFRILMILSLCPDHALSKQCLSILDLLWLMPYFITDISMSKEVRKEFGKLSFPKANDSYAILPSLQILYRELQPIQNVALSSLTSRGLVDAEKYKNNIVQLNVESLPKALLTHLDERVAVQKNQLEFLINTIGTMPLDGAAGLMRNLNLERGGKLR